MATDREVREARAVLDATFADLDRAAARRRAESMTYVNAEHEARRSAYIARLEAEMHERARQAHVEEYLRLRRDALGLTLGVDREYRQWSREEMDWLSKQIRMFRDGRTDSPPRRSGLNALAPVIEGVLTALLAGGRAGFAATRWVGGAPWLVKLVLFFVALYVVAFTFGLSEMLS